MIQIYFRDDKEALRRVEGGVFLSDNELILYALFLFAFHVFFFGVVRRALPCWRL